MAKPECVFAAVAILSILLTSCAGADTSCIEINVPDILGIGRCLGTYGNICTNDSEGAVLLLVELIECALQGITSLNLGSQLSLILQLVTNILQRFGLGSLAKLISSLCKTLGGVVGGLGDLLGNVPLLGGVIKGITGTVDCSKVQLDQSILCEDPIIIRLPSVLNLGKCLNHTLQTCEKCELLNENILVGLFKTLTCLVDGLFDTPLSSLLSGLLCSVLNVLEKVLGKAGAALKPILNQVASVIGTKCSRTFNSHNSYT